MQKIIIYLGVLALLGGCAHKVDIQQGNILTRSELARLEPGMNQRQVLFLLGSPLVNDPFHRDRWDYVYSFKPGGGEVTSRYRVTLTFEDGLLAHYTAEGDIPEEVPLAPRLERR